MKKMVSRECPVCNKIYLADPGRLKHGRQTTCSRQCSYEARARKKRTSGQLTCPVCQSAFFRAPSHIEKTRYGISFCSKECQYKARSLGMTPRIVSKPYEYSPESKAKMIAASRTPKGKRVFHWMICANCSKVFDDPSDGRKRKSGKAFCSLDCCNNFRSGENNPAWRGGYEGYYGPNWRRQRRRARKRDNYICQNCGVSETDLGKHLDVHHIVRFANFTNTTEANKLGNLISLCHSCHMLVEWNGLI